MVALERRSSSAMRGGRGRRTAVAGVARNCGGDLGLGSGVARLCGFPESAMWGIQGLGEPGPRVQINSPARSRIGPGRGYVSEITNL